MLEKELLKLTVSIIIGIVMAIVANQKGFSWWRWIIPGMGLLGIIFLLCLPSASVKSIDEELRKKRKKRGNTYGENISIIIILLFGGLFAMVALM